MARSLPVSEDVYEMVSRARLEGESFSDVIRRLFASQKIGDIPKIFDEKEWEKVKEVFYRQKHSLTT